MNIEKLKRFVLERRAPGGGFTFCSPLPASVPETFYALYILKSLGEDVRAEEHRRFVAEKLKEARSISSIHLLLRCHKILGVDVEGSRSLRRRLMRGLYSLNPGGGELSYELGTTATYSFSSPDFLENLACTAGSLLILDGELPDELESFIHEHSEQILERVASLRSAFFAVLLLGKRAEKLSDFFLRHQLPEGGFSKAPGSFPPYVEDTFYALSALHKLGVAVEAEKHAGFLQGLQCAQGGFRRSICGGIPTLEDSYYAIASLKTLGRI